MEFGPGEFGAAMIWATSTDFGCAYASCDTIATADISNAILMTCYYGPGGDIATTEPFKEGSNCTQCSSRRGWCYEGLCNSECNASSDECDCQAHCYCGILQADCSCKCFNGWNGNDCSGKLLRVYDLAEVF
ncbi:hypothetical protein CAPTEDRAFT_205991 [Capitella teleta]|uniref:SCP domain-containing protein n=1 Tax=Capitella teleta TaxID=283909 RepID=R7V8B9_CAPTE|nr:hypothetical protein CAPTEDRAFT_205991 [Capitella teleta]|eukprot:ELU12601.1 hypothetical protein CAPTEDRAFT_205991 [Capitella teleta]